MRKLTIEFIRTEFAKERYKLLTTEYKNNRQKLSCICPRGHKYSTSWDNWNQGSRCPCQSNHMKPTIKFIRSEFEKEGYKLLTTEYRNCTQKLDYICLEGHKHSISWNSWDKNEGCRCPYCEGNAKLTLEFIKSEFAKEDYKLLTTEYRNNKQKLNYVCPNGHKHSIKWNDWQQGHKCPYCAVIISKGETEVRNFINSLGIEVFANNRNQIFNPETGYGLELDIFMPALNKAIEYNSEYWHQDKGICLNKNYVN
jgi:hypothetical protein